MTSPAIALDVMSLFSARVLHTDRARMRMQSFFFALVLAGGALFASLPGAQRVVGELAIASPQATVAREPLVLEADLPARPPSATDAIKRRTLGADVPFVAEPSVIPSATTALHAVAPIATAFAAFAMIARGYNATAPPQS